MDNSGLHSFPEFWYAKIASASNKIIQNSHLKKKVSLEEQKAQKEDWFLRGRQVACMILRLLPGYWRSWYRSWWRWSIHNDSSQWLFAMRWNSVIDDKKFQQMKSWRVCTNWDTWVWSTQNFTGIVWHGDSSEDIGAQLSQVENYGKG